MTQISSEKLVETYYMRVFSYAMTLAGDRDEAEELTLTGLEDDDLLPDIDDGFDEVIVM